MLKWLGRFLIFWPFGGILIILGYSFYQMPTDAKIAAVVLVGSVISIIVGAVIVSHE